MLSDKERQLYQAYFKTEIPYYTTQLEKYDETGRCSYNFYALFFGVLWMAYRKLYREIAIVLAIVIGNSLMIGIFQDNGVLTIETGNTISIFISAIIAVLLGAYANQLYIAKCKRELLKLIAETDREEKVVELAAKKGGVAPVALLVLLLINITLNILIRMV